MVSDYRAVLDDLRAQRRAIDRAIRALEAVASGKGAPKRGPAGKVERNREIVRLHVEERLTLTEIAERFALTRERIRQIVRKAGIAPSETQAVLHEGTMVEWACEVCGKEEQRERTDARARTCAGDCRSELMSSIHRQYTDEEALAHLAGLAERLGRTPTQVDINAADGPAHTIYNHRFGSLREAQRLVGLEPNEVGGAGHRRKNGDG